MQCDHRVLLPEVLSCLFGQCSMPSAMMSKCKPDYSAARSPRGLLPHDACWPCDSLPWALAKLADRPRPGQLASLGPGFGQIVTLLIAAILLGVDR